MQHYAPYDARAVANFLLDTADDRGVGLTQMSVLKIISFAHGWHLALRDLRLCSQPFEAWEHGPVVKVVRDVFINCKKDVIKIRAKRLILISCEFVVVEPHISIADREFITSTFNAYHIYDAWVLSDITHESGSTWDLLWNAPKPFGRLALLLRYSQGNAFVVLPGFRKGHRPVGAQIDLACSIALAALARDDFSEADFAYLDAGESYDGQRALSVHRGCDHHVYGAEDIDSILDIYVRGVALALDSVAPVKEANLRGYRVVDPNQPSMFT